MAQPVPVALGVPTQLQMGGPTPLQASGFKAAGANTWSGEAWQVNVCLCEIRLSQCTAADK